MLWGVVPRSPVNTCTLLGLPILANSSEDISTHHLTDSQVGYFYVQDTALTSSLGLTRRSSPGKSDWLGFRTASSHQLSHYTVTYPVHQILDLDWFGNWEIFFVVREVLCCQRSWEVPQEPGTPLWSWRRGALWRSTPLGSLLPASRPAAQTSCEGFLCSRKSISGYIWGRDKNI